MKKLRRIASIVMLAAAVAMTACTPEDEPNNGGNNNGGNNNGGDNNATVLVTTVTPSNLTSRTALCGVEVTLKDGHPVIDEIGVCWGRQWNPQAKFNHLCTGVYDQPFSCTIASLRPNTVYHVRAYALAGEECFYGEDVSFTTLESGGIHNDPEYVDLGLPSGTLWATFNVGANYPEEPGDNFAWGETSIKDHYAWDNYKFGQYNKLTKYCTDTECGENNFIDYLSVLQPEDDAATVNWGNGWSTPTLGQWREMVNNTTNEWTTVNGMGGRRFTGKNGNSIFLPAVGRSYYTNIANTVGSEAYYWTKILGEGDPHFALEFAFDKEYCFHGSSYAEGDMRYMGFAIRPVHTAQ